MQRRGQHPPPQLEFAMGDHGDGPRRRDPMSNQRFYAILVFALLVIAIVCGTVSNILGR